MQLEGFEAPAAAWEGEILPARMEDYDPLWLDALCLSGRVVWGRSGRVELGGGTRPIRTTPIAIVRRERQTTWREAAAWQRPTASPDCARC